MGERTALLAPPPAALSLPEGDGARPATRALRREERRQDQPPLESFEAFFAAEYSNVLRAMYLVTGNRNEAEELAQDTFVRTYERWHLVRKASNPGGYVYRIGVNLYRSKLRRAARAARKAVRPAPEPDPFVAADERDAIGRALAGLPKGQREAMVMVEWLGMTDDEAGAALGVSPITIRVRNHRARRSLRPLLRPDDEEGREG